MKVFLIVFFLLYGSMHAYFFVRLRSAYAFSGLAAVPVIFFLLLMTSTLPLVRYAESGGMETAARLMAWAGYLWMGWLLLFCFYSLAADIYRGVLSLAGRVARRGFSRATLLSRPAFLLSVLLSLSTSVYGFFEARNIRSEHLQVATSKLPGDMERFRIVQISDVHLGLIMREDRLQRIADLVSKADPDMLVSTGDLVDGQICEYDRLSAILDQIRPRYGKFAITGNHEFYAGLKGSRCFIEDSGFTLLRGQRINLANNLTIAGVDDPAIRQLKQGILINEKDLLGDVSPGRFRLLLKHRPLIDKGAIGMFDLQLSGHVHKGQIFPFSILTWLYYPLQSGFADVGGGSSLYVSRGTGTWGPPIRFLSPPEVTVIDLVRR